MERLVIDRFEGNYAVCERDDKGTVNIPINQLPFDSREGDCLVPDGNGIYRIDTEATIIREQFMKDRMNRLFK